MYCPFKRHSLIDFFEVIPKFTNPDLAWYDVHINSFVITLSDRNFVKTLASTNYLKTKYWFNVWQGLAYFLSDPFIQVRADDRARIIGHDEFSLHYRRQECLLEQLAGQAVPENLNKNNGLL